MIWPPRLLMACVFVHLALGFQKCKIEHTDRKCSVSYISSESASICFVEEQSSSRISFYFKVGETFNYLRFNAKGNSEHLFDVTRDVISSDKWHFVEVNKEEFYWVDTMHLSVDTKKIKSKTTKKKVEKVSIYLSGNLSYLTLCKPKDLPSIDPTEATQHNTTPYTYRSRANNMVVGVSVGAVLLVALIIIIASLLVKKRIRTLKRKSTRSENNNNNGPVTTLGVPANHPRLDTTRTSHGHHTDTTRTLRDIFVDVNAEVLLIRPYRLPSLPPIGPRNFVNAAQPMAIPWPNHDPRMTRVPSARFGQMDDMDDIYDDCIY